LGTLTYAPPFCTDPARLREDVAAFFRRLRASQGGGSSPYLWVPELHADGQRFHVHFAVGRFVPRRVIEAAWGHGFVHIKLLGDLPVGSTAWDEARLAARYLSKYVAKTFDDAAAFGWHRYEVAQGFQPGTRRLSGSSRDAVLAVACEQMGARPSRVWLSDEVEGWQGPPAFWVAW
jgi:hypothetical protein